VAETGRNLVLALRPLLPMLLCALPLAPAALADPMRLADPRPRWVGVRFEISPSDRPSQLDAIYTEVLRGWLEPAELPGHVRVSVGGDAIERFVLAAEQPVPGSFDDFVWIFEARSGAVVSARLSGRLVKTLDWGLFRSRVEAPIHAAMDTLAHAGFEPPRLLFGQRLFGYCQADAAVGCTPVPAVHYDTARGYVNAVGPLSVEFRGVVLRSFSPLGEAIFSELPGEPGGASDGPLALTR
jgi:hypothetical protein